MQNPESLARRILDRSAAFQWVVVINRSGETLARVYSDSYTRRFNVARRTQDRLSVVDAVFLEAITRSERWYGKMEFALLTFRRAKIMLTYSERFKVFFVMKIPRSAMAEYLYPKLKPVLGVGGKAPPSRAG